MDNEMLTTIGKKITSTLDGFVNGDISGNREIDNVSVVKEAYYNEFSIAERKLECTRIREKYPDRIPVICERAFNATVEQVDKRKFLVPGDLTVGQFLYVIRGRMKLSRDEALFVFVDGHLPPTSGTMEELYEKHHGEDGFLYFTYSGENTFGNEVHKT